MLSHDAGQPLTVIGGYAELLAGGWERKDDGERRRMAGIIAAAAGRLTKLVEEILTMARSDAGAIKAGPVPVKLADALAQAAADVGVQVPGIVVATPGDAGFMADPVHLQQILANLILNAGKYGRPPVELSARMVAATGGDLVELRVADHGPGVPEEFAPHLFDRFTRGGQAAGGQDGSGLGLFIVRKLAEANGGRVRYEPGRAEGACFVVTLPAAGALAPGRLAVLE
jgi:signal transduction histidine kinase